MLAINEITGLITRRMNVGVISYSAPINVLTEPVTTVGVKVERCDSMHSWQKEIVSNIERGKDTYAIASMGGGKTMPFVCYWAKNILGINPDFTDPMSDPQANEMQIKTNLIRFIISPKKFGEQFGTILIIVPTRLLAEAFDEDFRNVFIRIIIQTFQILLPGYTSTLQGAQGQTGDEELNPDIEQVLGHLGNLAGKRGDMDNLLNERRNTSQIVRSLRSSTASHFPQMGQNTNIPDEEQNQIYKNRLDNINQHIHQIANEGITQFTSELISTNYGQRTGKHVESEDAMVTIGTYEFAPNLAKKLRNKLRLIVVDEAHQAQHTGEITYGDDDASKKAFDLYETLDVLKGNRNCRLVMLSGTEHPEAAKAIAEYLNICHGRNFDTRNIKVVGSGNPAILSVSPDDSLRDARNLKHIVSRSVKNREWGTLLILFGVYKIRNTAEECLELLSAGTFQSIESGSPSGRAMMYGLRKKPSNISPLPSEEDVKTIMSLPGAKDIKDELLRKCVVRKFGFVYSGDTSEYPMDNNDKRIVAKLFKDKKIYVLMATDAIGIGMNVNAARMYIPSLEKPTGGVYGKKPMSSRDLAQLVHRAGRVAGSYATIYTPQEYYEDVAAAVMANPENFGDVAAIQKWYKPQQMCYAQKAFAGLWKRLNGLF